MAEEPRIELNQEDREFLENYLTTLTGLADSLIGQCQSIQQILALSVTHPDALKVFSGEEIVGINQVQRAIPDLVAWINKVKQLLTIENYRFIISGEAKEKLQAARAEVAKLSAFTDLYKAKIPKPKPGLIFWLLFPYTALSYLGKQSIHKVRIRKLKKIIRQAEKGSAAQGNR